MLLLERRVARVREDEADGFAARQQVGRLGKESPVPQLQAVSGG